MSANYQKKKRDDHLPPIDIHDIGPKHQKKVRRTFVDGEGKPPLEVLRELEKAGIGGKPPYLAIRGTANDRGRAMIVVRHSATEDEESTECAAGDLTDPYQNEDAKAYFDKYCARLLFRLHARYDPASIRFSTLTVNFLHLIDPKGDVPGNDELKSMMERAHGKKTPAEIHRGHCNSAKEILLFTKERRLGSLTKNFGKDYMRFAKKPENAEAGKKKKKVPKDGTIAIRLSFMRVAFEWFRNEFRPPFRVEFDTPDYELGEGTDFVWEEVARSLLFCLGYVWDGLGFKTRWVMIGDEWHLEFERTLEADKKRGDHNTLFAPVIRLLLIYWFTGTRLSTVLGLGYLPMPWRGWIDVARDWIHRNGRKSPQYYNKPRENSPMLPCVSGMFGRWEEDDRRMATEQRWPLRIDGGYYVVHNGRGGPADGAAELAREALAAVGVVGRIHDHKGGGVTAYWHAGFPLGHIAFFFGNREDSLDRAYRSLKRSEAAVKRPRPEPEKMKLGELIDPTKSLPPMRRSDPLPPPGRVAADPDRLIRGELERAIAKVLHG
jgi:hypothetical protein